MRAINDTTPIISQSNTPKTKLLKPASLASDMEILEPIIKRAITYVEQ